MDKEWLRGKSVIIVGASDGIGKHLAFNLILKYNCNILAVSNDEREMLVFYDKMSEYQDNLEYYIFDAKNEKSWQDFALSLKQNNKSVDVLINCVGELPKFSYFEDISHKEIVKTMNTNFYSCVFSIRHILQFLKQAKQPCIVNVSCMSSSISVGGTSAYSASKSALKSYTEVLSQELDSKFYVALVHLGRVKTNLYKNQQEKITKTILNKSMSPNIAATKIINGMRKRKRRIVIGIEAGVLDYASRLFPSKASKWINKWLKRKKVTLYDSNQALK